MTGAVSLEGHAKGDQQVSETSINNRIKRQSTDIQSFYGQFTQKLQKFIQFGFVPAFFSFFVYFNTTMINTQDQFIDNFIDLYGFTLRALFPGVPGIEYIIKLTEAALMILGPIFYGLGDFFQNRGRAQQDIQDFFNNIQNFLALLFDPSRISG